MSDRSRAIARVRRLAAFLAENDAISVSIERGDEVVEVARRPVPATLAAQLAAAGGGVAHVPRVDTIKAELVGIFRFSRPLPSSGELLAEPRELGSIEALGIRNPVHSLGVGRIVSVASTDGAAVEYGQPLFRIDRG